MASWGWLFIGMLAPVVITIAYRRGFEKGFKSAVNVWREHRNAT
jgi:hypothetical protein